MLGKWGKVGKYRTVGVLDMLLRLCGDAPCPLFYQPPNNVLPTLPTLISTKGKGGKRRLHRGGWMWISDAMTSYPRNFLNFPTPTTSRVSLPRIMDSLSAGVSPVIQGQLFPVSTASFSSTITLVRALWDLSSAIFKRYPWPSPFPFTRLQ